MSREGGNALISVYDKTGIVEFSKGLVDLGWKIYASGGTATAIGDAGIAVSEFVESRGVAVRLNICFYSIHALAPDSIGTVVG